MIRAADTRAAPAPAGAATGAPADIALSLREVSVDFPTSRGILRAVDGVSLDVARRTTLAVVGESGSGKSVMSLATLRLLPPGARISGQITLQAHGSRQHLLELDEAAMRRIRGNRIAMIFQEPMTSLNPQHTIGRQVAEVLRIHQRESARAAWDHALDILRTVGIGDARRRMTALPHELSGGMRQRVLISIALACRPEVLIADEPTTALDVTVQAQILDLLRQLQADMGMAMVFISHDLAVVHGIADRVAVMYAGRLVEQGPTDAVLARPKHPYTQGLIASIPRLDRSARHGHRIDAIPGTVPDLGRLPAGCVFAPRCRHARAGLCDVTLPALEDAAPGHAVRCLRWREIEAAA